MDRQDPLVSQKSTINPYVKGCGLIARRILWDLQPQSWVSRNRLRQLKNGMTGKKAVILCNGPSLNQVDFNMLKGKCYTFGLNKINLLFDRSDFRPDSITAVNPFVIEQNKDFFNETDIPLFLDSYALARKLVGSRKYRIFLHSTNIGLFAKDCSVSINQGYTVTYVALQLAFHMGFSEVALVGCDHHFATKGPANKTVTALDVDLSHFDERYFSSGVQWHLPDLMESEVSYRRAKRMYEAHHRKIFNCTVGGRLEIFERKPLEDFLRGR